VYNTIKQAASIEVSYAKNEFNAGDLRPEHYFNCTQRTTQSDGSVKSVDYELKEGGQTVYYEVNFNQSLQVNTEGRNLINSDVGNNINDLVYVLNDMQEAEDTQTKLKAMLEDTQYAEDEDAVAKINQMLTDLDTEIAVKKENLQKTFSANITNFQNYLNKISATQSDLGSRMSKLEMIKTRVTEQYESFTELKSQNEDVETDQVIIDFNEANLVYETALAATSNIVQKTLLDYI
jgi:flagellar hook-associated protein 3 FlgL